MSLSYEVRRDARLHEETVKEAPRHVRAFKPPRTQAKPEATGYTSVTVDRKLWAEATSRAPAPGCVEIVSASEVIVHNSPAWRKKRYRRGRSA